MQFFAALVVAAAVSGCSSGRATTSPASTLTTVSSSATSTSTPVTTAGTAVDPNAPDVNAAGDIPDNQVFVPYVFTAGPFTVKVPEGWARTDASGATTFTDNFNSVRLEVAATASEPTVQSARTSEVPAIRAGATNFQLTDVTTVHRNAGSVVLVTYTADSAPNPVTGAVRRLAFERYELWNNGREAILVLAGPVGADNVDPWRTVTDSFVWG